jgi:IclR family acetate operon transcriptional repressor
MVGRVFAILRAFGSDEALGASALARATGLPRATVHRIASQLVDEGLLVRVDDKYRPSLGLFELGHLAHPARLRDAIIPYLEDLQRVTGADAQMAALDATDVVYVEHIPTRGSPSASIHLGARMPAHASAAGKVLLAHAASRTLRKLHDLQPVTPRTITDLGVLEGQLAEIRKRGFGIDVEEAETGRFGVAVPVPNRHSRVLGALSLTGPVGSIDVERVLPSMQMLARTLTRVGEHVNVPYLARLRPAVDKEP